MLPLLMLLQRRERDRSACIMNAMGEGENGFPELFIERGRF